MPVAPFQDLRDRLGEKIATLDVVRAPDYASFIRAADPNGPVPCWGAIVKRFEQDFPSDDERLQLMQAVLDQGDLRVLTLFIQHNRGRNGVMTALIRQIDRLPAVLQVALAAMVTPTEVSDQTRGRLQPIAREILEAGEATKVREVEQFEVRAKKLLAFEYFVPDVQQPQNEP